MAGFAIAVNAPPFGGARPRWLGNAPVHPRPCTRCRGDRKPSARITCVSMIAHELIVAARITTTGNPRFFKTAALHLLMARGV